MKNGDYLFNDIFDKSISVNDEIKNYLYNKKVCGDIRLSQGKYYTDSEKERYKRESLDRHLP